MRQLGTVSGRSHAGKSRDTAGVGSEATREICAMVVGRRLLHGHSGVAVARW